MITDFETASQSCILNNDKPSKSGIYQVIAQVIIKPEIFCALLKWQLQNSASHIGHQRLQYKPSERKAKNLLHLIPREGYIIH